MSGVTKKELQCSSYLVEQHKNQALFYSLRRRTEKKPFCFQLPLGLCNDFFSTSYRLFTVQYYNSHDNRKNPRKLESNPLSSCSVIDGLGGKIRPMEKHEKTLQKSYELHFRLKILINFPLHFVFFFSY